MDFLDIATAKSDPELRCLVQFGFKCPSCHSGMQFFHISASKSAANPRCFDHVFFQICFVPQGREIFDLSSDHMVPCPVPAALASLLFDPPEPQNIGKTYFLRAFFFFYFFLIFSLALPTSAASFVHMVGSLTSYFFDCCFQYHTKWCLVFSGLQPTKKHPNSFCSMDPMTVIS